MWLQAQTANQRLKQNWHTQNADDMQAFYVLNVTQLEAISQHQEVSWEGGLRV